MGTKAPAPQDDKKVKLKIHTDKHDGVIVVRTIGHDWTVTNYDEGKNILLLERESKRRAIKLINLKDIRPYDSFKADERRRFMLYSEEFYRTMDRYGWMLLDPMSSQKDGQNTITVTIPFNLAELTKETKGMKK
jgi:hypothetical protein